MAVPHGPASVGAARRRLRRDLGDRQIPEPVIDDAVLILSELLSNACRYARPLGPLPALGRGARAEIVEPRLVGVPFRTAGSGEDRSPAPGGPGGGTGPTGGAAGHGNVGHGNVGHAGTGGGEEDGGVLVRWQMHADGVLTLEVTDGGAQTRPSPASPSLTSHGGRGLGIVDQLASDWGVRDAPGEVTVWAALPARARHARRTGGTPRSA
ncbi:ATP-binding protein [Streptomyces sp. BE303]|uniref:ATP-binding protein n=1 Tax=Streptomyces sp. BE303 TaxID=3002528 RepID=UPI002E79143C|nr:ATP-binding protein [Streptomyces sp. BE303]MED7951582.1 ATP-binding protein [Streptomyces sp. BE303]